MSPFSLYLTELRRRRGIRQGELSALVGYEQSYLSALEIGLKGPPTHEFVERLIEVLSLPSDEQMALEEAFRASQRKFTLPLKTDEEVFRLANRFWEKLPSLSPVMIRVIKELLSIEEHSPAKRSSSTNQINREARM
ncbi:MAG: helix-turn-helix domain-containing protein [Thiobacillus sp.]